MNQNGVGNGPVLYRKTGTGGSRKRVAGSFFIQTKGAWAKGGRGKHRSRKTSASPGLFFPQKKL